MQNQNHLNSNIDNMLVEEIWNQARVNFGDNYEVSNLGNVRRIGSTKNLSPANRSGYFGVAFSLNNKKIFYQIHRLVALSFVENGDPSKKFVNHKDGNKFNNRASNLEWVTASQNVRHSIDVL